MPSNLAWIFDEDMKSVNVTPWITYMPSQEDIWATVDEWVNHNRSLIFRIANRNGYITSTNHLTDGDLINEALLVGYRVLQNQVKSHRVDLFVPVFCKTWNVKSNNFIVMNSGMLKVDVAHVSDCDIDDATSTWKHTREAYERRIEKEQELNLKIAQIKKDYFDKLTKKQTTEIDKVFKSQTNFAPQVVRRGIKRILEASAAVAVCFFASVGLICTEAQAEPNKQLSIEQVRFTYPEDVASFEVLQPMHVIAKQEKQVSLSGPRLNQRSERLAKLSTLSPAGTKTGRQFQPPNQPQPGAKNNPLEIEPVCEETTVLFGFDQDEPSSGHFLKEISTCQVPLNVSGHTCDIGPEDYNLGLSKRRAENISEIISKQGLLLGRVDAFGESRPASSDPTKRHLSRRVVITPSKEKSE